MRAPRLRPAPRQAAFPGRLRTAEQAVHDPRVQSAALSIARTVARDMDLDDFVILVLLLDEPQMISIARLFAKATDAPEDTVDRALTDYSAMGETPIVMLVTPIDMAREFGEFFEQDDVTFDQGDRESLPEFLATGGGFRLIVVSYQAVACARASLMPERVASGSLS